MLALFCNRDMSLSSTNCSPVAIQLTLKRQRTQPTCNHGRVSRARDSFDRMYTRCPENRFHDVGNEFSREKFSAIFLSDGPMIH